MKTYVQKLEKVTYSVHHNPNGFDPFQVRLVGMMAGRIDNLQNEKTQDIIGHGKTFEEAAQEAWQKKHKE